MMPEDGPVLLGWMLMECFPLVEMCQPGVLKRVCMLPPTILMLYWLVYTAKESNHVPKLTEQGGHWGLLLS